MNEQLAKAINTLQTSDVALVRGDGAIVYRHGRWHDLTMTIFGWQKGIQAINFMTDDRAMPLIQNMLMGDPDHPVPFEVSDTFAKSDPWLSYAHLLPFDQVSDTFALEVETKILAGAADYLPILEGGNVGIGGGFTTDTQWGARYDPAKRNAFLESIALMISSGESGPYLKFYDITV